MDVLPSSIRSDSIITTLVTTNTVVSRFYHGHRLMEVVVAFPRVKSTPTRPRVTYNLTPTGGEIQRGGSGSHLNPPEPST